MNTQKSSILFGNRSQKIMDKMKHVYAEFNEDSFIKLIESDIKKFQSDCDRFSTDTNYDVGATLKEIKNLEDLKDAFIESNEDDRIKLGEIYKRKDEELNNFIEFTNTESDEVDLKDDIYENELELRTFEDFQSLELRDDYICNGFLYPQSMTMFVSPPKKFKSITALGMGMSIAQGKSFLGMKVKQTPVLYLDLENNDLTIQKRQRLLFNGFDFEERDFPFYTLTEGLFMDAKKKIQEGFIMMLEKTIEKYGIGVLIIDTLHRTAYYDENKADDINLLYTKVLKPLMKNYSLSIMFLHHTTKEGEYRGSGDLLGMVDNYFKIKRNEKSNKYTIINQNGRNGEIDDLQCEAIFDDDFIKLKRIDKFEEEENFISKQKEITSILKTIFSKHRKMKRKDLIDFLVEKGLNYNSKSVDRALKFLSEETKYLISLGKGIYEFNESLNYTKTLISDKEHVLNYLKDKEIISLVEINEGIFILEERDIKLQLKKLKQEGVIYEPKKNHYQYLG